VTGRGLLAATAALLAGGCASAQQQAADVAAVVGCYQFERNAGARELGLPWGVELHETALPPGALVLGRAPDARVAETATSPTARQDHPFGYWASALGDSLEIGYPGPGGGFVLRLTRTGQDLVGLGRAVGDALRPGDPAGPRPALGVTARRVLCGAL
jgi:hypothetical protein